MRDPRVWFDRVRPGLLLYGIVPPPLTSTIALTPAMKLASRVTAVKGLRAGEVTGYGARFTAERPTTIAIVPAGYADGLDWRLANRGAVLIRGHRAPIVGSVCMDMLMADVTGTEVSPGDEVVMVVKQKANLERGPVQMCARQPLDALLQRGAGHREGVDRVGLAALARRLARAGHVLGRDPNYPLTASYQETLKPARNVAAILDRPHPLGVQATRPEQHLAESSAPSRRG